MNLAEMLASGEGKRSILDMEKAHPIVLKDGVSYVPGPPPLMIFADRRLPGEVIESIREDFREAMKTGATILVSPGLTVYQLVDGKWQRIGPEGNSDVG